MIEFPHSNKTNIMSIMERNGYELVKELDIDLLYKKMGVQLEQ